MSNALAPRGDRAGVVRHFNLLRTSESFRDDVLAGLAASDKAIPPKYFYDARGSALFEAICELPEYYPTRTEMAIMRAHVADMARFIGANAQLIEFGSGASVKTCILLEHLEPALYVPIDISESALHGATQALAEQFPGLNIAAVCGDFTKPLQLPQLPGVRSQRRAAFFPGSTVGNFTREEAAAFLALTRRLLGPGGVLLIGVDTKKSKAILDVAYDDAQGVTAAFNLNLLERINRELGGDFDLALFRHKAFYDEAKGRIEMHIESLRNQSVLVAGVRFGFRAGETIHTEISCKYAVDEFQSMARGAGFQAEKVWLDADRMFSVHALIAL